MEEIEKETWVWTDGQKRIASLRIKRFPSKTKQKMREKERKKNAKRRG